MVDADGSAANIRTAKIVDRKVGAALIFVFQPPKTARLAGFLVAGKFEEHRLAELGEYCNYISL